MVRNEDDSELAKRFDLVSNLLIVSENILFSCQLVMSNAALFFPEWLKVKHIHSCDFFLNSPT